jgi:hypothetical protein
MTVNQETPMSSILQFGEKIDGFDIPVLNERAVRASAGILFFLAIVSFMNAWLTGNFQPTRVFVIAFLIDFSIRIFINPRYAPSLVVGQWFVRKQNPEYVGAPQKRFAWAIGFVLAATMLYLVVINNVIGPVNLVVCSACLLLLFFESAFGICIGCHIYNFVKGESARHCPGGVCEVAEVRQPAMNAVQGAVVIGFVATVAAAAHLMSGNASSVPAAQANAGPTSSAVVDPAEAARCKVPDFAKAMGHEEKWKLHNNCK